MTENIKKGCSNCRFWDTTGFGLRNGSGQGAYKLAPVGTCRLVARSWYPVSADKMISLDGAEHSRYPELIQVITKREFGCNQWGKE